MKAASAPKKLLAPFTAEQVAVLNRFQQHPGAHPFTCARRGSKAHRKLAKARGDRDTGILVATCAGWVCPACRYTQNWAHEFMAEPETLARLENPRLATIYNHLMGTTAGART